VCGIALDMGIRLSKKAQIRQGHKKGKGMKIEKKVL